MLAFHGVGVRLKLVGKRSRGEGEMADKRRGSGSVSAARSNEGSWKKTSCKAKEQEERKEEARLKDAPVERKGRNEGDLEERRLRKEGDRSRDDERGKSGRGEREERTERKAHLTVGQAYSPTCGAAWTGSQLSVLGSGESKSLLSRAVWNPGSVFASP